MAPQRLSDMVVDVIKSANPQDYQNSIDKLKKAQHSALTKGSDIKNTADGGLVPIQKKAFSSLYSTHPPRKSTEKLASSPSLVDKKPMIAPTKHKAYKKFEALILQNFVENMFTTDSSSVFGKGQAGDIWKSMMAEAMSKNMAEAGGIGIAKLLENNQAIKEKQEAQAAAEALSAKDVKEGLKKSTHTTLNHAIIGHNNQPAVQAAQKMAQDSKLSSVHTYLNLKGQ